jgi:hypothetical protein
MAVVARINSAGAQQVSVTVPSARASSNLTSLNDVNATTLEDGSILQYDANSRKFITRTDIQTLSGTLKLNGGNF